MKIGVFTVCMPEFEPFDVLEVLAELGYDGIEWRVTKDEGDRSQPSFWAGNRSSMTADEVIAEAVPLRRKAEELGLEMPSLAAYIDSHDLDIVQHHMKAAVAIGAGNLRVSPGKYVHGKHLYRRQLEIAREAFARVAELARKHKVRALIETHMGLLTPSVFTAMAVLEGLDPEHVGIIWDPGNQVVEGSEVYSMALETAGEYLAEVHVKNMKQVPCKSEDGRVIWKAVPCPVSDGIVDWPAVIDALGRFGYDGWLFYEDFSSDSPTRVKLQEFLPWFRNLP